MSEELVEKGEMEMEQSALLVGHTSEVGTHCKLLARFRTISGFAENWASFGLLELRGPKPGRSARVRVDPDLLEVGERERSECDMMHSNQVEDDYWKRSS